MSNGENCTTLVDSAVNNVDHEAIKNAIEANATEIISLLADNIQDDSLYLLFEWDKVNAVLTSCITDASKTRDTGLYIRSKFPDIKLSFDSLQPSARLEQQIDLSECIKFWLHDYLTTCSAFFKFSLVAIFHASSRNETELL
ncbi:MAG TPA: hypothetical protein VN030_02380 [Cellvibrio sp.]|nr:hypothetical protein [Cellvibrio sp.]